MSSSSAQDLVAKMDKGWWPFRFAARSLGAAVIDSPTSAGWTYKEMLAHVAAWHALAARRIDDFAKHGITEPGEGPDAGKRFDGLGLRAEDRDRLLGQWDMDGFNAAVRNAAKDRPAKQVLGELDANYRRLRDAVAALTDEQVSANVSDGQSFVNALVEGDTFGHYREHDQELRAGLPATGAALAERVDEDWARFREAVRHLGRSGLSGVAHEKWTHKDLLAHVVGWLEDLARRIGSVRAGTFKPMSGQNEIDEYNARSVASHALVGPEAMLDELDASYRRTRAVIEGLTAEEIRDPRILSLVATRTFLHWEEHGPELEAKR